jgi:hypothetical protein
MVVLGGGLMLELLAFTDDMMRSLRSDNTGTSRVHLFPRANNNTVQRQPSERFQRCFHILYEPSIFVGGCGVWRRHGEFSDVVVVSEQEWRQYVP